MKISILLPYKENFSPSLSWRSVYFFKRYNKEIADIKKTYWYLDILNIEKNCLKSYKNLDF